MNKQIKQSILSGFAFSGTVLFSYLWFAAWSDLPTQSNNSTLTADIWNQMITTVNNIWKSQLWVDQTRQDVTTSRVAWTTYTNNTWKPIMISIDSNNWSASFVLNIWWNRVSSFYHTDTSMDSFRAIIPNNTTYSITVNAWTIQRWFELK